MKTEFFCSWCGRRCDFGLVHPECHDARLRQLQLWGGPDCTDGDEEADLMDPEETE